MPREMGSPEGQGKPSSRSAHKSPSELKQEQQRLREDRDRVLLDFVSVDLETSLTFRQIALNEREIEAKRKRNQINARKGYDAVVYFSKRVEIPPSVKSDFMAKLRKLKHGLEQAGERFEP